MNQVGFGLLCNGKPSGLWPRNWTSALSKYRQLRKALPTQDWSIVPVYVGAPVDVVTPPLHLPKENA